MFYKVNHPLLLEILINWNHLPVRTDVMLLALEPRNPVRIDGFYLLVQFLNKEHKSTLMPLVPLIINKIMQSVA